MIGIHLVGDKAAQGGLEATLQARLGRIEAEVQTQTLLLQRHIKADKLSGQVLRNRTNRLRGGLNARFGKNETSIWGTVGPDVWYGKLHELGGTYHVREHERIQTQVFGRLVTPHLITVHAHDVTFPVRSYLRTGLADRRDAILAGFKKAAADG